MPQATPSARVDSSPILDGPTAPLRRALDWAFGTRLFDGLAAHGNTAWAFPEFVSLVLLWVWSERTTLAGAFAQAAQLARDWFGRSPLASYTGFAGALTRWTPELIPLLRRRLRTRMAQIGNAHYRIGGWVPIAVDGSRTTAPRTRANEAAFHPKKYGSGHRARSRKSWKSKKRRSKKLARPGRPQIWLTLLWHMGLKMPWSWKCGPSNSSERHHFAEALETEVFPERTLFCADAGFVGYDLWAAMADKGHRFLIRVGANVRLLRKLGDPKVRGDFVHFWPKGAAARDRPPMTLRLLRFQSGRGELFAVTNALSNRELGDARASELYRARWGVEVQFRSLKQTFGRGRLHSRTPDRAYAELEWALVGLWLIQLRAAAEQIPAGIGPERTGVSVAIRVFRAAMLGGGNLKSGLRRAVKDPYKRRGSKASRYRSKSKDHPAKGRPRIDDANAEQRRQYRLAIKD